MNLFKSLKSVKLIYISLLLLIMNNALATSKIILISNYKVVCAAEATYLCYRVKDQTLSTDWISLYEGIENFKYEWGYDYVVNVEEIKIKNPPEDGFHKKYKLIEEVSKTKNTNTFSVSIESSRTSEVNDNLVKKSKNIYLLYSDTLLKCNPSDCKVLDKLIEKNKSILVSFNVSSKSNDQLQLLKIECSSEDYSTFSKKCFK